MQTTKKREKERGGRERDFARIFPKEPSTWIWILYIEFQPRGISSRQSRSLGSSWDICLLSVKCLRLENEERELTLSLLARSCVRTFAAVGLRHRVCRKNSALLAAARFASIREEKRFSLCVRPLWTSDDKLPRRGAYQSDAFTCAFSLCIYCLM